MRIWPDWFHNSAAEQCFERYLLPSAGWPNFQALQIGAYCGDASEWLLTNVLTDRHAWLVDVDTWEGSNEVGHQSIDFAEVKAFYDERMRRFSHVGRFQGTSDQYFAQQPSGFDFIYIDGSHQTEQVLRDAVNADQYLKVDGILAFDDYLWWEYNNARDVPGPAIDAFIRCYEKRYEVLEKSAQVWLRRVR